jgi:hypothetical protein
MMTMKLIGVSSLKKFYPSPVTRHLSPEKVFCHKINGGGVLRVEAGSCFENSGKLKHSRRLARLSVQGARSESRKRDVTFSELGCFIEVNRISAPDFRRGRGIAR